MKKFWIFSINNYICDASYSGKELKEKHRVPSFREFWFIKDGDISGFTEIKEISNKDLVEKLLHPQTEE